MRSNERAWESGTSELEVLVFTIAGGMYGVKVAEIQEIMRPDSVNYLDHEHMAVEGIYERRDEVVTVIDLPRYLGSNDVEHRETDQLIGARFHKKNFAFRVQGVVGISRILWRDIMKFDLRDSRKDERISTGIAQCGENRVTILDFEKIVDDIAP